MAVVAMLRSAVYRVQKSVDFLGGTSAFALRAALISQGLTLQPRLC
jgi:hypothetical protein